jgi:hypothetical protein
VSLQVGAPVRIVALVGVLAALAIGAWTFLVGAKQSGSTSSASSATSKQLGPVAKHPIAAAQSAAAALSAHNRATAAGVPDTTTPSPHAPVVQHTQPLRTKGGAPITIASVLRHHRVAVVLVYDPQAHVDSLTLGEAQLGAAHAHAGFLRVSVLRQRQILPFAKTYGVLQVPTLLFFARPGKLVQKLSGFEDQDTVAQAALNAAHGLVATAG